MILDPFFFPISNMPCSRTLSMANKIDPGEAEQHRPFSRYSMVTSTGSTASSLALKLSRLNHFNSSLTACCLDPPVLDRWDYSRRPRVLFPVAGLPCRCGLLSRRNTRPCPAALTPAFLFSERHLYLILGNRLHKNRRLVIALLINGNTYFPD